MEFEIKGLEPEAKESLEKAFNTLSEEIQTEVKEALKNYAGQEAVKSIQNVLKEKDGKSEVIASMQKQLDELDIEIQKVEKTKTVEKEGQSLEIAMRQLLVSDEFKEALKEGFPKGKNMFSVKADTSDITGTVNMTRQNLTVKFDPERALAFMPFLNTGVVGNDRNRVLWVEGSYTSNVGYVSEGTGQATADTGAAVEKSRAMAKISAKLPLTAELLEDADYIASAFRMKMQEKAMLFVDGELYDGDGDDSTQPNHIYGIQGHATAFDATAAGIAGTVQDANIGDLVDAVILQAEKAEQRGLNRIWMNPSDFFKLRTAKDADGNRIFVKDINGNYTIAGLQVTRTSRVAANTMLVADTSKIQLWWKRNPEVKFSQMNSTDFVDDKYTAVMFLRNQLVIEGPDTDAVIYVSDIDAAITAIEEVTA
jgi:HK97 family phage major capsid protein